MRLAANPIVATLRLMASTENETVGALFFREKVMITNDLLQWDLEHAFEEEGCAICRLP